MSVNVALQEIPILGYKAPDYLRRIVPEPVARQFGIVPLAILEEELILGAYRTLSYSEKTTLEKDSRYPIQLIPISFIQVRRLQSRLYKHSEPRPPHLPLTQFLPALGLDHIRSVISPEIGEKNLEIDDFSHWHQQGWVTQSQWSQLISLYLYLPTKTTIQPSSVNTLLEFIEMDPALKRELQSFVPLWWANHTLFLGISDLRQVEKITNLTADWPCHTVTIIIPEKLKDRLKNAHSRKSLMAPNIREEQIAEKLLWEDELVEEEIEAAMTLSKQTGTTLYQALLQNRPDLSKLWLEKKAALMDTIAIHEEDLPANFEHVLTSLFDILPVEICQMIHALPLNFMDGVLVVGLSELHPGILRLLEEISGYPVEPRLMAAAVIQQWLGKPFQVSANLPNFKIEVPQVEEFLLTTHLIQPDQLSRLDLPGNLSIPAYLKRLTSAGLLNDEDVAQVYAILYQIPYLALENVQIDEELIHRFSQSILKEHRLLPLLEYEGNLWVAVAHPLQGESLKELEQASHLCVWPFVAPEQALESALQKVLNLARTDKSSPYLVECINFLVDRGFIKAGNVDQILADIIENDRIFDRVIQDNLVDPRQNLYEAFAQYRSVSYVSLKPQVEVQEMIDPLGNRVEQTRHQDPVESAIARRLDHETARRLGALPFAEDETTIKVAFASPLFDAALTELAARFDKQLEPVITDRDELDQAIERFLGRKNIGTLLVESGLITRHQLNDALNLAENTRTHIGQALIHRGYITENQLYAFLSKQVGIPLFDLSQMTLSQEVAETFTPDEEWEWGVLPLAIDDRKMVVGMVDPVNQDSLEFVRGKTDLEVVPVLITENDFENALETLFKEEYTARSISALLSRAPENSAAQVLTKPQAIWMIVIAIICVGLAIWNLKNFLIGLNAVFSVIYLSMVVYKFYLIANAIGTDLEVPISDEELAALRDDELPTYSILIPVYKEAAVLPSLLKAVENLDYPKIKLDVKVLLEQDDEETIAAFHNSNPPDFIQGLIVPTSLPKTKPKACNYGLIRAKGELIVIFDAEDKPDPDQLKKVVIAFNKSPANVICLQAKLNYFNRQQNLLTQWFSSEYSMWFDLFLPGLDARNVPIPLGGTSNHFKKFALIEAGAWDPHNMTEDADLGIRLYKLGYRTKIVDTSTYEEANSDVKNWVRQRSRWVKGHIQTWLVHMRHPFQLIRDIGLRAFFSFQMVVGGNIFTVIINPLYWIISLSWLLFRFNFISELFPGPINYLGAFSLYFGNFAFTYMNVAGAMGRGYYDMVKTTLLSPLYWGLMSIGGWRGFIQIINKPHYWEKTIHGLAEAEEKEGEQEL